MSRLVFDNGIKRTEFPHKEVGTRGFDFLQFIENNPKFHGILEGLKTGGLAALAGAAFNKVQGSSAIKGALIAGLPIGLIAGLAKATKKKIHNMDEEAYIRYYADMIKEQEPYFFLPKQPYLREIIMQNAIRGGIDVHRKDHQKS